MIVTLNKKTSSSILLSAQVVGIVFYILVFLAYCLGLPSTDNLIGQPTFRLLLQLSGGFFLILIFSSLITVAIR
jgi:hypothetical protein